MALPIDLAVVGGSGFYEMPGLEAIEEIEVWTPFGAPSDTIRVGTLEGRRIAFLARHGRQHHYMPSEIPQRANFWALKSLGVTRVLAVSAVGSLREDYAPGEMVVPDQLMDRTNGVRPSTFFGNGVVAHVSFAHPFCPVMRKAAIGAATSAGAKVHDGGSYVVIEGPAFGTKAESEVYRGWGKSIVGMTAIPEAKIAREAEICYAVLATVTDYDAWHASEEVVTWDTVSAVMKANVAAGQRTVRKLLASLPAEGGCDCGRTLDSALVTAPEALSPEVRVRLAPILRRRLGEKA